MLVDRAGLRYRIGAPYDGTQRDGHDAYLCRYGASTPLAARFADASYRGYDIERMTRGMVRVHGITGRSYLFIN